MKMQDFVIVIVVLAIAFVGIWGIFVIVILSWISLPGISIIGAFERKT